MSPAIITQAVRHLRETEDAPIYETHTNEPLATVLVDVDGRSAAIVDTKRERAIVDADVTHDLLAVRLMAHGIEIERRD